MYKIELVEDLSTLNDYENVLAFNEDQNPYLGYLVTDDYTSERMLVIFQQEFPAFDYSIYRIVYPAVTIEDPVK